jgi:hypothetical protein
MIFERGADNFNEGAFEEFTNVLSDNIVYHIPEVSTKNFYTPEKNFGTKADVLEYWAYLHDQFQVEISRFEYLKIGKVSEIRCFYDAHFYALDVEMHFDEYGKVLKIINKIFRTSTKEVKQSRLKEELNKLLSINPLSQTKKSYFDFGMDLD